MKYFIFDVVVVAFVLIVDLNLINAVCGVALFLTGQNDELIFYSAPVIIAFCWFVTIKVNDRILGLISNSIKLYDYANDF